MRAQTPTAISRLTDADGRIVARLRRGGSRACGPDNGEAIDHDATLSPADALRTAESSPAIPPSDMSAPRRCPDSVKAGAGG